jgi:hypothetical protein
MDDPQPTTNIWRVSTTLLAPTYVPANPQGGLPERLKFESRMPEQTTVYGDIPVAIIKPRDGRPPLPPYSQNPQIECVELVADVPAGNDAFSAIERLAPVMGSLVDLMSFDMGTSLGIGPMDALDITPPVSIGEERAFSSFSSSPFDRHMRSVDMGSVQGSLFAQLPRSIEIADSKTAAILRWFVKSLDTDLLHDQFIFLWIALETLCFASDFRVEGPYKCRNGHEIGTCPECEAPTTKELRGETLVAFLQASGVDQAQAKELWKMRQLMHGAIQFDSKRIANLGTLVQPLRSVVAAGLKAALGKSADDMPRVALSGLSIHPSMGVAGTRRITEEHVSPIA